LSGNKIPIRAKVSFYIFYVILHSGDQKKTL